jgi:GNAT superfamily N-acetyltransferase
VIRAPRPDETAALAELVTQLGYPSTAAQLERRLERIRRDPAHGVLVAEADGVVAGLATLYTVPLLEHDDPGFVFASLVVGERFRRRGIATELAQAVEAEALARGCTRIVLSSAHRRADAHAFYERLGYEHTGRRYAKELVP